MNVAVLVTLTTIAFSGTVPPHLARDGTIYAISAPAEADVGGSLRGCGITDTAERDGRFSFAVGPGSEARVACLRKRLPAATLERRARWND